MDEALAWIDHPPRGAADQNAVHLVARLVDLIDHLTVSVDRLRRQAIRREDARDRGDMGCDVEGLPDPTRPSV